MDAVSIGILIVCIAASAALLAVAYFAISSAKTLKHTVERKVDPLIDEAAEVLAHSKETLCALPVLVDETTSTIASAKTVIDEVEVVSSKVAHVAEKASEIVHMPAEFVHSVADSMKSTTGK